MVFPFFIRFLTTLIIYYFCWSSERLFVKVSTLPPFYFAALQKHSSEVFYKKAVLKNFAMFMGKYLYWSLLLPKFQAFRPALLKKRLQHRCFPVNSATFLRTLNLKNICERLLLLKINYFAIYCNYSALIHLLCRCTYTDNKQLSVHFC